MTKLSSDDILKLAKLARLKLSEAEVKSFQTDISQILGYVEMLDDVNTEGLAPTSQVTGLTNVMRTDELIDYGADQQALLKNAPRREDNYIKVNRMIG